MPKKKTYLTCTDQFCGAGGSSQGAQNAGIKVEMAMNHWKLAIETHETNFQDTRHDCTDISACDPRRYPSTDILITSPECTTHSPAGGNNHKALKNQMDLFNTGKIDAATERSRATMWDVCRFAEYHQYNAIIVENVVEAKTRWPLFDVWLTAMHTLGYMHKCVYLNSQHCHPTPQSRDRMYVVFWKKGNKAPNLDMMPKAYCGKCGKDVGSVQTWKNSGKKFGKYNQQYVYSCPSCTSVVEPYYYASMNIVDWSDIGKRIGDRKKPLADKTMSRIQYGLGKYGGSTFQFHMAYGDQARGDVRDINEVGFGQTTVSSTAIAGAPICPPFIIKLEHGGDVYGLDAVNRTQTCRHSQMIISNQRSVSEPIQTQTKTQGMGVCTPPFVTISRGKSKTIHSTQPINTVSTGGIHSGIVSNEAWKSFITYYYGGSEMASGIHESLRAVTCNDRAGMLNYQTSNIEDCYYRMLKPSEIKLAMAFGNEYRVLGSAKDQVKQLGNAVTPPAMEWLINQVKDSLS